MNIIQQADALKGLPDQVLQQELLKPSGAAPSYLVLSELQRRKEMRSNYQAQQGRPNGSMAEEMARGLGGADVGKYADAMRSSVPGAMQTGPMMQPPGSPPMPMPQGGQPPQGMGQPPPEQGFDDGGAVEENGSYSPMERYRRLMQLMQRNQLTQAPPGSMNVIPPAMNGNPPLPPPNLAPQTPMQGPPSTPDNRTMKQRFDDAMRNQSPDASVLLSDKIKQMPGVDPSQFDSLIQQYQNDRNAAVNPPAPQGAPWTQRDPDASLGETISRRIRGVPGPIPREGGGMQDNPPDVQPPINPPEINYPNPGGINDQTPDPIALNGPPGVMSGSPTAAGAPPGGFGGPPPGGPPPGPGGGGGAGAPVGGQAGGIGAALNVPGFVDQVRGMQAPDRFAELEALNRADKQKLKESAESDKGMALLAAGLGIMGGTSPFAAVNIGRGALAGVQNWSDAQKEMRLSEMAIRNADQQIAIARASRDERQLEMAVKTKMHAQEMADRAAERQARAGEVAATRAAALEERRAAREDNAAYRKEMTDQHRIDSFNTAANRYGAEADRLEMKAGDLTLDETSKKQLQAQAAQLRQKANESSTMGRQAIIDREINSGRLVRPDMSKFGYDAQGNKIKKGQMVIMPDGSIVPFKGE